MRRFGLLALLLAALALAGCSREAYLGNPQAASPEASASAANSGQNLPFKKDDSGSQQLPFKSGDEAKNSPSKLVPTELTIPAGTPVPVRLQANISSASAVPGQQFDAVLEEPLVIDGKTVAPSGAAVVGRVVAARHSGRLHNSGYLRLTLASIEMNGKQVPVQTSSIFAAGGSHKKRNLAWIGGGTGAGALIGAIAGGGKGALIGSAIGAAGGTTTAYATGKKDIGFAAERRLTFRLAQPVTVRG